MSECKHEIEEVTCSMCRPRHATQARATRSPAFGPWIVASYDGECAGGCGQGVRRGDQIRSDGAGNWLCTICGNDQ